jgi:hypothetical protein
VYVPSRRCSTDSLSLLFEQRARQHKSGAHNEAKIFTRGLK